MQNDKLTLPDQSKPIFFTNKRVIAILHVLVSIVGLIFYAELEQIIGEEHLILRLALVYGLLYVFKPNKVFEKWSFLPYLYPVIFFIVINLLGFANAEGVTIYTKIIGFSLGFLWIILLEWTAEKLRPSVS
ncbi:hypothetical protein SAMN00777080_2606 [Aquiflexum balticum DSM 16537]|uniref:Uncharacterized protein n=1 Tax=Aquiflexum balticum DSM 16537 TaxID=758820 RepID=A0A1W2H515_9BACT|nr:hypothetical protein [Aquiflexum balticum]SMD43991.1 hypothetical protein SAMN00777080_2606 [Aquiflexum balticum DSM 16537]